MVWGGGGWCLGVRQIFTSEVGIEWNKKVLKDDCGEFKKERLGGGNSRADLGNFGAPCKVFFSAPV